MNLRSFKVLKDDEVQNRSYIVLREDILSWLYYYLFKFVSNWQRINICSLQTDVFQSYSVVKERLI